MAIPMERAKAPVRVTVAFSVSSPANTAPADSPSGMLCRVTARINMVVFLKEHLGPSAFSTPRCRWGTRRSMRSKKPIPSIKPTAAGTKASFPIPPDMSMAGISRDHTEAATITPEANPSRHFWIPGFNSPFTKNTQAAPRVVPRKGINSPTHISIPLLLSVFPIVLSFLN